MALVYPGTAAIPQYESSLAALMPAFEKGRSERKDSDAFDAAAKAFGDKSGTPTPKQPNFIEQLAGLVTGTDRGFTRPNAVDAIDAAAPQTPAQRAVAAETRPINAPIMGGTMDSYIANARTAESGGNDQAANPNSSALGRYQFLDSTWQGLAQKYPELGLTADGRTDPAQQERAMAKFTQDNASALQSAGIPVNPGTLYAAHFLGAGGATKALSADPSTPMSAVVDPAVIQANPQLRGQTAGDFAQWANGKGGNGSGGYQPPMRDEGAGQGQPYVPDEATMRTLLASEATRPLAIGLIQAHQETEASRGRLVTEQGPDGSIWQRDTLTGERKVLQAPGAELDRQYKEAQIAALNQKPAIPPTDDMKEYDAAKAQGFTGSLQDWITAGRKAGATNVTVGGDNKYDQTIGENLAKQYIGYQEGAENGQQTLSTLSAMQGIMADPSFYSGAGADQVLGLKRMAVAMGMDPNGVSSMETFNALSKKATLDTMGGSLGTAISDGDRSFVVGQTANLGNTPEGNTKLIEIQQKLAQRKIEVAQLANEYAARHGGRLDADWGTSLSKWATENPLFPPAPPPDGQPGATPSGADPARPTSEAEYNAIPSGGLFIDPDDGQTYRKP